MDSLPSNLGDIVTLHFPPKSQLNTVNVHKFGVNTSWRQCIVKKSQLPTSLWAVTVLDWNSCCSFSLLCFYVAAFFTTEYVDYSGHWSTSSNSTAGWIIWIYFSCANDWCLHNWKTKKLYVDFSLELRKPQVCISINGQPSGHFSLEDRSRNHTTTSIAMVQILNKVKPASKVNCIELEESGDGAPERRAGQSYHSLIGGYW